jgi:hypothetical protein
VKERKEEELPSDTVRLNGPKTEATARCSKWDGKDKCFLRHLFTNHKFSSHCLLDQFVYIRLPMDLSCEIGEICTSVFEDNVTGCRI